MSAFVEKMPVVIIIILCCSAVGSGDDKVRLESDVAFKEVLISETVQLTCCFTPNGTSLTYTWIKYFYDSNNEIDDTVLDHTKRQSSHIHKTCGNLTLGPVGLNDTGFYQCRLTGIRPELYTHGTYLLVYHPLEKTINISESTKNRILAAEGILLLLCVLLPSATLLFKSKRLSSLEKKQSMKEEENIYQGLNLDECCSTYDQIERSQAQGPYQDVCNITEEERDIQLEKP